MKAYADQLVVGLGSSEATLLEVSPTPLCTETAPVVVQKCERYLTNLVRHPRRLSTTLADVYHIIDHANSNWIRVLPKDRTVVTCHDLILLKLAAGEIPWSGQVPRIATAVFRWSVQHLKLAAAVICVSECTKADLVRLLDISADRIFVIHQGLSQGFEPAFNLEQQKLIRSKYSINRRVAVMHVGSNVLYKNLEGIIDALACIPPLRRREFQLIKVGSDFTPAQSARIRRVGIEDCILSLGRVGERELIQLYQSVDMLLSPSLYEGFGWPPLEAMACGTPVVSSSRGSLAEVVGDSACIVDPDAPEDIARGILQVADDSQYRSMLVESGLRQASKFSRENMIRQTLSVYNKVADKGR